MTKAQALAEFRICWKGVVDAYPRLKGDTVWKREEWNNFVDALNKEGYVSNYQANNWSNPF